MNGKYLNSKEIKRFLALLEKQWGFVGTLDYVWYQNNRRKLYIVNKEFASLDQALIRVNTCGLYFAEITMKGDLRLSIEGSQMIGKTATRQVLSLDAEQVKHWMYGDDVSVDASLQGFYLLKSGDSFIGCGSCREGKLVNFVSKNRRIKTLDVPS
jgi:NOL1/NOP2/fmu family ribosome biogenesis protein